MFNLIASEVHNAYETLSSTIGSEEKIFSSLSIWIRNKLGLDDEYITATEIIAAFFVQNCEVFHEITE